MSRPGSITAVEELARLRKAIALADVLSASGITARMIFECAKPEDFWRLACQGARFESDYYPSPETRELTIRLLAEREETARRLLAMKESTCKTS